MLNNNWSIKEIVPTPRFGAWMSQPMPKALQPCVSSRYVPMLIVLALSLVACAGPTPAPCEMQKLPSPPVLSESVPTESYSKHWAMLVQTWQKKLDDMQMTQPSASQSGPAK